MSPEKLVHMANQIGRFFTHQGEEQAINAIADHLTQFWDPRMRDAILAHLATGGTGLDPLVQNAVQRLKQKTTQGPTQPKTG